MAALVPTPSTYSSAPDPACVVTKAVEFQVARVITRILWLLKSEMYTYAPVGSNAACAGWLNEAVVQGPSAAPADEPQVHASVVR
jgi:hypothetical protein